MAEIELWRDIEGYKGTYQVSSFGRVRSMNKIGENGRQYKGVIKKIRDNGRGYMSVSLSHNGKKKNFYVHRLVAFAFLKNDLNKKEVNHKDANKENNFVSNLEWCTRAENVSHAVHNKLNRNAGAPQKIYVFDGDNTVVYRSYKEIGSAVGKSKSWCSKRLEKSETFIYKGLTISKKEIEQEDRIIYNVKNTENISDGYHKFSELYFHRMVLFSVICNTYASLAWKSWKHDDGTMYDDYFIVGIDTPQGSYTYHYHKDYWYWFTVGEVEFAPKWDGHKPEDIDRLLSLVRK